MAEPYITKEVLEAVLSSIDEGIHVIDPNGITIFYNEVAGVHDGMTAEEVVGKPLLEAFPSLNRRTSTLLRVIETKKPIYDRRQSYMNLHGKMIETVNTTLPLKAGGRLYGAVEIAKDYSKLKILSERLVDLESSRKKAPPGIKERAGGFTFEDILTANPAFQQVIHHGNRGAGSDSAVLVYGESGSGKELFVQGIHHASRRSGGPLIAQNCAALPASLLESLLFGTAKGSYTGAVERPGLFELADGGTLFLDELQSMPVELQAGLLRVLEDGVVRRIGGTGSKRVDVRIIAAMNIHPARAMQEKKLREDLFYRLNVLSYRLPPLRERPEDILLLAEKFIEQFNEKLGLHVRGMTSEVEQLFLSRHWRGNVRELKHTVEHMMNHSTGKVLTEEDLPAFLEEERREVYIRPLREAIDQMEADYIEYALNQTNGNVLQASKLLHIPRQTLQYKIQKRKK